MATQQTIPQHLIRPRTYYTVFAGLLLLLALTVAAAQSNLGPLNVAAALTIAGVKALLIVLYFMHLRYDSPLVRLAAGAGLLWLLILAGLTLGEVTSRARAAVGHAVHAVVADRQDSACTACPTLKPPIS